MGRQTFNDQHVLGEQDLVGSEGRVWLVVVEVGIEDDQPHLGVLVPLERPVDQQRLGPEWLMPVEKILSRELRTETSHRGLKTRIIYLENNL